jgi:hypothetical protein
MLERPALLLRPWRPDGDGRERLDVVDPATGAALGVARRVAGRPAWLRWWAPPAVSVHESDDEPLLLTLRPGWGGRWVVHDADGHPVGAVAGARLLDRVGHALARVRRQGDETVYADAHGRELARGAVDGGVRLTFADGPGSPFVRMLLVAAALVHHAEELGGGR